MKTITARVKEPRELLKAAESWTEDGGLIIDGHEFTLDMRRHCGQKIALSHWRDGSGYEYGENFLFSIKMLEDIKE
jgi:hypothetical protein